MSVNKVIILGRLGKDPEVRNTSTAKVANFSVATSESYKDKDGNKKETTDWHNVVAWRGLADIAEKYLHKGDQVYIEGRLKTRSWESNGQTRYVTEVFADKIVILSTKAKTQSQQQAHQQQQQSATATYDDIPWS
jgi:single-strand DNA-binding protein